MGMKTEEIMAITPEAIAVQIDEYLEKTGKSRTAFGWELVRDPNLVFQLHKGRNVTLRLLHKIFTEIDKK